MNRSNYLQQVPSSVSNTVHKQSMLLTEGVNLSVLWSIAPPKGRVVGVAVTSLIALLVLTVTCAAQAVPQLPQSWVNNHECDHTGTYDKEKTVPGDYAATFAGLSQFFTDWATATNPTDQWWRLKIPAGTVITGGGTVTVANKTGVVTKCAVIESTTPLTASRTVCSHTIRDLTGGVSPRNPGCTTDIGKMWTLNETGSAVTPLTFASPSNHVVIRDAEIRVDSTNSSNIFALVAMGSNGSAQSTLASVPSHIGLDRVYVHGYDSTNTKVQHAISVQCAFCWIANSYVEQIHMEGTQTQVIFIVNTPGPAKIVNNWLEGGSETIIWGGATAQIKDANGIAIVPTDYEVRRNRMTLDPNWINLTGWKCSPSCAHQWDIANRPEIKSAVRTLFDGNIIEYSWKDAQTGALQLFQVRACSNGNPCTGNENASDTDLTFTSNVLRHAAEVEQADPRSAGSDAGLGVSFTKQRESYANNLAYDIVQYTQWGNAGSAHDMAIGAGGGGNSFNCTGTRAGNGVITLTCTTINNGGTFNGLLQMFVGDPALVDSCSDPTFNSAVFNAP